MKMGSGKLRKVQISYNYLAMGSRSLLLVCRLSRKLAWEEPDHAGGGEAALGHRVQEPLLLSARRQK